MGDWLDASPVVRPDGSVIGGSDNQELYAFIGASTASGAFPLADNARDSALLVTLPAGSYTAVVSGADGGTGIALVELYEVL